MARPRLPGEAVQARLLGFPADEREMIRHATLSSEDFALIARRRGEANQLGFALMLVCLRHPGRVLEGDEVPPAALLNYLARQLDVEPDAFAAYARRDQTRRTHLAELTTRLNLSAFDRPTFDAMVIWALPLAATVRDPEALAASIIEELRRRRILLPPIAVLELVVRQAYRRATTVMQRAFIAALSVQTGMALEKLLEVEAGATVCQLAWLRTASLSPAARNLLGLIERLRFVRDLGLPRDLKDVVPQRIFRHLVDEATRMTAQHLAAVAPPRRLTLLVVAVLQLETTLTDAALSMFDKLLGSLSRRAERRSEERAARSTEDLRARLRTLAGSCRAMIGARDAGNDLEEAIEQHMGWAGFIRAVGQAEAALGPDAPDTRTELLSRYAFIRQFSPALLDAFQFRGGRIAASLLQAVEVVREMNCFDKRTLPEKVPTGFIRRVWRPLVLRKGTVDRQAYEICMLCELRDRLRAGDVWVEGSRDYRDFEDTLMPRTTFDLLKAEGPLPLAAGMNGSAYLQSQRDLLDGRMRDVATLACHGKLPDIDLNEGGLKISPLRATTPPETDALQRHVYAVLPRVRITDLLLEVDAWTGFSECFTHQRSSKPADDRAVLLAAVMADGINLGLTRMAETTRDMTLRRLAWVHDWHVREDCYAAALARLIEAHRALPLAAMWGDGTTSSSDGQFFQAGGRGEAIGEVNARHSNEPGVAFYTHISDQFGPFHTKVIAATASEAPHVLDGLLSHDTGLPIIEHYTDTGGATDHVFGLCALLGFRFAPRLRDFKDRRFYILPGQEVPAILQPFVGGTVNASHVEAHWDEVLRMATSIRAGTVTASAVLRRLAAYPRQNGLAIALREIGRIDRTLFALDWLQDIDLRRRTNAGLNKGEARNALARAVFFHRLGELRDRSFESQLYRASGLNLLVAAIILWNTRYLETAVETLRTAGRPVPDDLLRHVAPLGWEHVSLTGDYTWNSPDQPHRGRLRPLRSTASLLAA
jgi:TnpA family transposase